MGDVQEQTIVISDLLSFLACKIKLTSKEKLLKTLRKYYSEKDINEAQRTLLASLPEKKSTRHGRRVKNPDPLIAMYDCFQLIPEPDQPIFVCKNLNNVPELDTTIIKQEPAEEHHQQSEEETEMEVEVEQTLREEQKTMKSQIADIAFVVKQLKDQLQNISQQNTFSAQEESPKGKVQNTHFKTRQRKSQGSESPVYKKNKMDLNIKKKGLAYLQSLIDEDEEISDKDQSEKDNESDFQDDLEFSETEEYEEINAQHGLESISCEVILKEEPEDHEARFMSKSVCKRNQDIFLVSPTSSSCKSKYLRDEISPSKAVGQKVIYIKNEDHMGDEENSIEIASASDYLGNLDDTDPSSRIFLEVCRDGSLNLLETPKLSTLADIKTKKKVLKNPKLWCCLCGLQFDGEEELIEHISYHKKGSRLSCCKCSYVTMVPEEISKHLRTQHGDTYGKEAKRMFRCVICKFKSKSRRRMEIHVDCHYEKKSERSYECQVCSKSYMNHASLRKHKKIHAGVRPFVCEECGLSFVFRSYLRSHLKTHESQKAFRCTFCSSQFISKDRLRRHERTHTGEKPYKCMLCNHRSARSDGIDAHYVNVHSHYKPFECQICSGKFVTRHKLIRHLDTHSQNKSFYCKECEKAFKSIDTLKYHCKYYSHHQDIKEVSLNV